VEFFSKKDTMSSSFSSVITFQLILVSVSITYHCYEFLFINISISYMLDAKTPPNFG